MSRSSPGRPPLPSFHARRLDAFLASHGVKREQLAEAAGLNHLFTIRVLRGSIPLGELGRIRIAVGLLLLGHPDALPLCGLPDLDMQVLGTLAARQRMTGVVEVGAPSAPGAVLEGVEVRHVG